VGIITVLIAQITLKLMSSLNTFALSRKVFDFFETCEKLLWNQEKDVSQKISVGSVCKCIRCMCVYVCMVFLHVIIKINKLQMRENDNATLS